MEDRSIPRQSVLVTLTLSDSRSLTGELQIDLDSRLSDFMNGPDHFVIVKDRNGSLKILNKAHIIEIMEV
jgi:hypothetical protein